MECRKNNADAALKQYLHIWSEAFLDRLLKKVGRLKKWAVFLFVRYFPVMQVEILVWTALCHKNKSPHEQNLSCAAQYLADKIAYVSLSILIL